jgi:hypothetical protein
MLVDYIPLLLITYTSFGLATMVIMLSLKDDLNWKDYGFAIVWPVLIPIMFIALLYSACVASTKRIRVDLANRKVLKEFDKWNAQRLANKNKETK